MNRYLSAALCIILAILVALIAENRAIRKENTRLQNNNTVLSAGIDTFRTALGQSVARVGELELTVKELRQHNNGLQERLAQLQIKPRRVQSLSINAITTSFNFAVPLQKKVILPSRQTVHTFTWKDPYNSVEGAIINDSVSCNVKHCDTLDQVIYREPRRFLFFRFGTKAIKQVVSARDPNTTIVYSEYIVLKREK